MSWPTQVEVSGTVYVQDGQVAAGAIVSFTLSGTMTDGTNAIAPRPVNVKCDSGGSFTQTLSATDDTVTQPGGLFYNVKITWGELTLSKLQVVVPHSDAPGPVDLYSLPSPAPLPPGATYVSYVRGGSGIGVSPSSGTGAVVVSLDMAGIDGGNAGAVFARWQ